MAVYQVVVTPHFERIAWCKIRAKGVCDREVEWKVWVVQDDKLLISTDTCCQHHVTLATKKATDSVRSLLLHEQGHSAVLAK